MKPYGIRAEQREFEQNYYGGYCVKAREAGLEPMAYVHFQEALREVLVLELTKKQRMQKLIEKTEELEKKELNP